MTTQVEQQTGSTPADGPLLAAAAALVAGGVFAFYYFADWVLVLRVLVLLAGLGGAAAVALRSATGNAAWQYVRDCYQIELRKTTWPTRAESVQTTLMIAVVVLVSALLMWGLDSTLLWGVKALTGRG